jgi:Nif-specific regulatory protein
MDSPSARLARAPGSAPENVAPPCVRDAGGGRAALRLPVAPRCNAQCSFCDRERDCTLHGSEGDPTVLLSPQQAVEFAREALRTEPGISSVGITGPGEPLANPEATFRTLERLRDQLPDLPRFVGTNGLALVEHVDELARLGVALVIVTINGLRPEVVARLVEWVQGPDGVVGGREAAEWLIARQLAGVRAASERGIAVRVHFLLFPGINDGEVEAVAEATAAAGAGHFHVQPFTTSAAVRPPFAALSAPSVRELQRAREAAARHLTLVQQCSRCASDALGCPEAVEQAPVRALLERSSRQRDTPSSAVAAPPPAGWSDLGERGVTPKQLQLIARIARWLATSEDDAETTLRLVLQWLDDQLGLQRGTVCLADAAGESLQAVVTHGLAPEQVARMHYRTDEGVNGRVFTTGRAQLLPSLAADPTFLDRSGARVGLDVTRLAHLCVPIRDRGTVLGTISADKDNRRLKEADSDLQLLEEIGQLIAPFVQRRRLEQSLALFQRLRSSDGPFARLIGRSPAMDEVRRLLAKVAETTTTVLLTGETGTGKSAAAALVHDLSPRSAGPFVEVNCGAIPANLIESELFGHERGAFTGALQRRVGVFERARGGTVFLDEVGELEPSAQTRLLRVLQTRRFERVGGNETLTTDARLVTATNKDLAAAVAAGTFRPDLYYRLAVFPVVMPPLRERGKADLMLLTDSFIDRFGREMGKRIFRMDTPAIDMITAYHWPGNVRELENVIERAVVLAETDVIHGHHLPPSLQMDRYAAVPENLDFATRVARFETELITEALKDANGNQTRAAERLGLTKRIIQYKIKAYAIAWQRFLPRS